MTPERYRDLIEGLGLSQNGAGGFLGVDERTSRRWADGTFPIPLAVELLLETMVELKLSPGYVDRVARWKRKQ